jgi:hypothetical protein
VLNFLSSEERCRSDLNTGGITFTQNLAILPEASGRPDSYAILNRSIHMGRSAQTTQKMSIDYRWRWIYAHVDDVSPSEKVGHAMNVTPVPDGLPSFCSWIQDKRVSNYSSRFLPLIDRFTSSCRSTTIHRQKFNKICVFLDRVKSAFASAPDLAVLLPQSTPFIRFDLSLRSIIDLA